MKYNDKNGIPLKVSVGVYYVYDEKDGEVTYDEDYMRKEFDEMMSLLPQYINKLKK